VPELAVTASVAPTPPVVGEMATVIVKVRNDGPEPVADVALGDELSPNAAVRSATSPAGTCTVAGRRADCVLGGLAPGETAVVEIRVLLDPASTSRTVVQHLSLGGNGYLQVSDRSVSTLVADEPPGPDPLLALPGPTVTLVAFVGFVLASGSGPTRRLTTRP
jgi:uncharacterized repeat protein (TIGR01451 family)